MDEDEEVKEENNDNEEDKEDNKELNNDQTIKCHTFSDSQDRDMGYSQGPQYDDEDEDEEVKEVKEVKEDNDDITKDEQDNKEEDNDQIIKFHTYSESQAQANLNVDDGDKN